MKRIIYAINNYFFDAGEISASDALWFYGITGAIAVIGVIVWIT